MSSLSDQDVAAYLAECPDFFEKHPELLDILNVPHPQHGSAVSLVERQSHVQRQRIHSLEHHVSELKFHGSNNDQLVDKLVVWAHALLTEPNAAALPDIAVTHMKRIFDVPYAAVRLWDVAPAYQEHTWAEAVGDDIKRLAVSMRAPFSGVNTGFDAAVWMHPQVSQIRSLALMPLRPLPVDVADAEQEPFGLMVLGSHDRERFQAAMGTEFLARFADLAAAAFLRLRDGAQLSETPDTRAWAQA